MLFARFLSSAPLPMNPAAMYWLRTGGHRSRACLHTYILSSTSCGPKIQPSLNPGAKIFEKDPRCSVLSGAREYIVGTGLPEYLSSL